MADLGAAIQTPFRHGATSGELKREADLSTEQACTQAPSRFPRAHGHQRRTQSAVGAALARTQAALRLTRRTGPRIASMERLKQRADFLAAASGSKVPATAFVLQARKRGGRRAGAGRLHRVEESRQRGRAKPGAPPAAGNRAAARTTHRMRSGHDYVLIGRRAALKVPFARMAEDFEGALRRVHAGAQRQYGTRDDRQ